MNHRRRWKERATALAVAAFAMATWPGCSPPQNLRYEPRTEIKGEAIEIPARHQTQIAKYLDEYFGSPLSPRLMAPAPESGSEEPAAGASDGGEASSEGAAGEGGEAAAAAPPKVKLVDMVDRQTLKLGAAVYRQQCAGCHGVTGDGNGPAAKHLNPPPRDYRLGRYKFASTPRGTKPRQEDLERIIRRGAKGTSMPAFRWMPDDELEALIHYVKLLSNRGELELKLIYDSQQELDEQDDYDPETVAGYATEIYTSWDAAASQIVLPITVRPAYDEESIRKGAEAFVKLECLKCHGKDGRGNKKFNVGPDDWGRIAFAADLTSGMLHGGRRPVDIYRRIYSGINATPMPGFAQPNDQVGETAEQRSETIWHLVHFVTSIVEGKPLPVDVIEEAIKANPLPADGAAPAASSVEPSSAAPADEKPADDQPAPESKES